MSTRGRGISKPARRASIHGSQERTENASHSRLPAVVTLGAVLLLWIAGCGVPAPHARSSGDATRGSRSAEQPAAFEGAGLPASAPSEHSVYLLPSSWTDQFDAPVDLADLAGRAQVVALVYTHCSFACPRLLAQMKRMEAVLGEEGLLDRVGFTLVSIDPERDTPERLARFAESSRLDPRRWTLLNGGDEDVRALSILLGIEYREADEGQFEHSNILAVLDPEGVPVYRMEGLSADPAPALGALRRVVE